MIINVLEEDVFINADWSILKDVEFRKQDCEVLATGLCPITDDYLKTYPNVKYILSATTGLDHIKISNKNVRIISLDPLEVEDISASAEFTILLILSILKRIDITLLLHKEGPKNQNQFCHFRHRGGTHFLVLAQTLIKDATTNTNYCVFCT